MPGKAAEVLSREFAEEIRMGEINEIRTDGNLATVAIVGERMRHTPGVAGRLFDTLGRNGIKCDSLCARVPRRPTYHSR